MIEQRTPEWHAARLGKVTASRVADVTARTKSGWGASRANYMAELIAERLTGEPTPRFQSEAMRWGTETEPLARAAYGFRMDRDVREAGFVLHPTIHESGASPDGYIDTGSMDPATYGLVEIKCPTTATHLDTLLGAPIPAGYLTQMQWQMACTNRAWCDFVSFDPRLPESMRLHVERVYRDDARIAALETDVRGFLAELADKLDRLRQRYEEAA